MACSTAPVVAVHMLRPDSDRFCDGFAGRHHGRRDWLRPSCRMSDTAVAAEPPWPKPTRPYELPRRRGAVATAEPQLPWTRDCPRTSKGATNHILARVSSQHMARCETRQGMI